MKKRLTGSAAALLVAMTLVACGGNETATETSGETIATDTGATAPAETSTATSQAGGPAATQEFVTSAARAGMAEVTMGQLGQQKATHPDVKAFAQRMVTEHIANNQELQAIATPKGMTPPTDLDPMHKSAMDHLQSLSGAEFDKAFMMHMVDDHQKAVDLFTSAQSSVQDPEIAAYVTKTLPVLQQHLQAAKDTQAKVQ